jgi:hypothetical protein
VGEDNACGLVVRRSYARPAVEVHGAPEDVPRVQGDVPCIGRKRMTGRRTSIASRTTRPLSRVVVATAYRVGRPTAFPRRR